MRHPSDRHLSAPPPDCGWLPLASAALDGCDLHVSAWTLSRDRAAARARGLLAGELDGHVTDPEVLHDLAVVVDELATNAAKHTKGPCEMRILLHGGAPVLCEIADTGAGLDDIALALNTADDGETGEAGDQVAVEELSEEGRGLRIVAALTGGRCGASTTHLLGTGRAGKSVWFHIPTWPQRRPGAVPARP